MKITIEHYDDTFTVVKLAIKMLKTIKEQPND